MSYSIKNFDVSCVPAALLVKGDIFLRKKYKEFSFSSVWVCDFLYHFNHEGWCIIAHNLTNFGKQIVIPVCDSVYMIIDKSYILGGDEK